jgi:acetolactate synthase small subunit
MRHIISVLVENEAGALSRMRVCFLRGVTTLNH